MSKPTKAQNPDMDFGFYATFPRIVRTGYKDVSAVQKWLYVCLKDLAGDDGTCYRTIRALVEETGLSAGMISESILVLHKAGLIHAEKKRRSTGGKEVWHISIVDIWKKNGEAHPAKRSPTEQTTPYIDVHTANVHHTNDKPTECSPTEHKRSQDEQECSRGETEVITITRPVGKNITEARTEGTLAPAIAAPSAPSSSQDIPYVPDYSLPALDIKELSPVVDEAIERVDEARTAIQGETASEDAAWAAYTEVAPQLAPVSQALSSNTPPAELSTRSASSPQARAKVEPKQGNSSSKVVTSKENHVPPTAQLKPQLTLLGGQVREWYEIIRATRLRLIANNVKALNELGEMDGMSFENLKETIETIEEQDLVKKKSIPIGLQELSSEEGYWRFDKWYPVVVRNRRQQSSKTSPRKPSNIDQEIEASRQAMKELEAREKVRAQR